jgi:hypothetical protein
MLQSIRVPSRRNCMSLVLSFAGKYDYIPNDTASSLAR